MCRFPLLAGKISFREMESILTRERKKVLPSLPSDVLKYNDILNNYELAQNIYKGMVKSSDGGVAYLFSTNESLNYLNEATVISIDGTFAVTIIYYTYNFK